jgi:DnaJ family protein A protein 2
MPLKKSDARGDLYLIVDIKFPDKDWTPSPATLEKLREILPKSTQPPITTETVDEVDYESDADIEAFGQGDPRGGSRWQDDDEEGEPAQCATQ